MRFIILLCITLVGVYAFSLKRDDNVQLEEEKLIRVARSASSKDSSSSEEDEKSEIKSSVKEPSEQEKDDSDEEEDSVMEKVLPVGNMIQEGSGDIEASGERVARDDSSAFFGFGDFEGSGSGDRVARDVEGSGEGIFSEVVRVVREGSGDDQ